MEVAHLRRPVPSIDGDRTVKRIVRVPRVAAAENFEVSVLLVVVVVALRLELPTQLIR